MLKPKEKPSGPNSLQIKEDDIFANIVKKEGSTLFLGKYTLREAGIVLKKRSFTKEARKRKLWPVKVVFDSSEFPPLQRLQIFHKEPDPDNLIVDLKLKESLVELKESLPFDFTRLRYNFLVLDWLTLQNPLLTFSEEKTHLPGQNHPGLNLGRKVLELFIYLARLNRDDGILVFPAFYHNALLFSRRFYFLNPEKTGEIEAIRAQFRNLPFTTLAWAVHLNCLRRSDGKVYEWKAEEQVLPMHKELKRYFESDEYKEKVKQSQRHLEFSIDLAKFEEKFKAAS